MSVGAAMMVVTCCVLAISTAVAEAGGEHRSTGAKAPKTLATQRSIVDDEQVESEFSIDFVGVFYDGDVEGGSIRFRHGETWGAWPELEHDGVETEGRWASELAAGLDADGYQVRVPAEARKARAVAINTTDGPTESVAGTLAATADLGCSDTSTIVTRCEWGADETLMTWAPEFFPTQKLTVHHTATANGDADPAATVRAIYRYQAVDRGLGDIGYQYLIDEQGRVYEGRYSGNDAYSAHDAAGTKVVTAAHIGGYNSGNTGIALLGTLTSVDAKPAARGALEQLLRELVSRHRIDPHGASVYVNPVNNTTKKVANIAGHRDWAATECPGGALYAQLPALRNAPAGSPPTADTTAPDISSVTASVRNRNATIRWTTNEPSTTQVHYRRVNTETWTATPVDSTPVTAHTVTVSSLLRATYEYQVVSVDVAANTATSTVGRFKVT